MRLTKEHFLLGFCVISFLVLGYFIVRPDLPQWPPYAASSADKDGVKGLYTLLQEKGHPVKTWRQEWRFLVQGQRGTLIAVQPGGVSDTDLDSLNEWVAAGNDVLLFDSSGSGEGWFETERSDTAASGRESSTVWHLSGTDSKDRESEGLPAVVNTVYRIAETDGVMPLLADEHGVLAARMEIGAGTVSLFLVPEWMRNETILEQAHFELIWPYLGTLEAPIWFDEYYLGLRERPGVLAVYPDWLLVILLQLGIAVALWLWYKGVRFSPAYTPREWTVRRGDETLLAAAGWYERRQFAYDALEQQMNYIRHLFRERWGVRTDARDEQLIAAARLHWNTQEIRQLDELLASWKNAKQSKHYSSKQLLYDSRLADKVILKLEKE